MGDGEGSPASVSQALAILDHDLDYLSAASLPMGIPARALRILGRRSARKRADAAVRAAEVAA